MDALQQKAQAFILRLLQNPSLNSFSPLQREEQIIQFLHYNANQLAPTLMSNNFFPGMAWGSIFSLLLQQIYAITDKDVLPVIRTFVYDKIDFAFFAFLKDVNPSLDKARDQIFRYLEGLLKKPDARKAFLGSLVALSEGYTEKYVNDAFQRKRQVHFELTKVQRLRMSKEEVKSFVDTTLLLRPIVFALTDQGGTGSVDVTSGLIQASYANKVLDSVRKQLNLIPEPVLKSAVNASLSFVDNKFIEATARIASILAARCRNYHSDVKVDRGADTPDKSWLSIARKNYKFYGFDVTILDEFYMIAAENAW